MNYFPCYQVWCCWGWQDRLFPKHFPDHWKLYLEQQHEGLAEALNIPSIKNVSFFDHLKFGASMVDIQHTISYFVMASITLEELHSYHAIDREIFSRLVITLRRDPAESLLVMAIWLWLEEKGYPIIIAKMVNLSTTLLEALAGEAVLCLNCLVSSDPTIPPSGVLPLTARIMEKDICLQMFYQNKFSTICGVKSFLNTVCSRIFTDILQFVVGSTSRVIPNQPLVIPGFPHSIFGSVTIVPRAMNHHFPVGDLWGWHSSNNVSEDDKTLFLTFSRGFPVTEDEIRQLFRQICGNCGDFVDSVHMQENVPSGEQPLFARMVLHSVRNVDQILSGKRIAKFRINALICSHVHAAIPLYLPRPSLICMGSVTGSNGYLSLTPEPNSNSTSAGPALDQVGRVLFHHPVLAWPASISTTFTVRISPFPNSNISGDGMAFIIAQDNRSSPSSSTGSYLGIMDPSTQGGVVKQIAVELDTYKNEWDPDENHVGIDTISIITPVAAKSLNSTGIELKSGRNIKVKIDYHGWRKQLEISMAYSGDELVSVLNQSIEMADIVPSSVFVGFTAATGKVPESHHVLDWNFTTIPLPYLKGHVPKGDEIKTILFIVIPIVMGLLIVAISFVPSFRNVLRKRKETVKKNVDIEILSRTAANVPKMFTYKMLAKATHNFSKENLLGTGGFGSVYKATLQDPPTTVAVKKISATSKQGEKEYFAEICTIGRLRHKNIVQLQGWCHEREHLLLVYEYMPNGSLDRYIGKLFLDWETRFKILTGLASALLYLHEESGNPVVHRDVKPNNIMLDEDFNAHLGDFGLARLLQDNASVTTMLAGTPGYLAPEVGFTGKSTPESDGYSFGMVVIEVVCGRRSKGIMDENSLVDYVWNSYGQNELLGCVDRQLEGKFDEEQVKRTLIVGLSCLHPDSTQRPKLRKVVQIFLNSDEPLMELPESRPSAVYVPVSSSASTTTNFGSRSCPELLSSESSREYDRHPDEIVIECDH
ncbi:hypothetical protein PTKIN_Ptkin19aG0119500 [Pterospermum kingtungense]